MKLDAASTTILSHFTSEMIRSWLATDSGPALGSGTGLALVWNWFGTSAQGGHWFGTGLELVRNRFPWRALVWNWLGTGSEPVGSAAQVRHWLGTGSPTTALGWWVAQNFLQAEPLLSYPARTQAYF